MPSTNAISRNGMDWFTAVSTQQYSYLQEHLEALGGTRDVHGATALMRAAEANDTKAICLLINKEEAMQDKLGMTALMHAARRGSIEAVTLLIAKEKGMQDALGNTALMHAVSHGHLAAVEALISDEAGIVRPHGWTALMDAASYGATSLVSLLRAYECGRANEFGTTALMLAAMSGADSCVRLLLPHEVHMRDSLGCVALVYAIKVGHALSISLLISEEYGDQDNRGHYPSDYVDDDSDVVLMVREYDWRRVKPSKHILFLFVMGIYRLLEMRVEPDRVEDEVLDSLLTFLVDDILDGATTSSIAGRLDGVAMYLHLPPSVLCNTCGKERFTQVALPCRHFLVCSTCRALAMRCPVCAARPITYLALTWPE